MHPNDARSPDKPSQQAIKAMVAYLIEVAGLTEQQALALATAAPPSEGWTATEGAARVLGFQPQVVPLLGDAPFVGAAQACKAKFCLAVKGYAGIGIGLIRDNGTIRVTKVFPGLPAEKAQVQTDDVVTRIDNEPVKWQTLEQVIERIRGAANTKVVLTLLRKGHDRPFDLTITREILPLQPSQAGSPK
jgi:PDZ domain